jgi:hypothetical protein
MEGGKEEVRERQKNNNIKVMHLLLGNKPSIHEPLGNSKA